MVELLVVISIIGILTVMTVAAVNFGFDAERSRSAARQVQSYLAGARDRAIYERHPVGVRFLIDPNVANTSTSMLFIEEADDPVEGLVDVKKGEDANNNGMLDSGEDKNGNGLLDLDIWIATRTSGQPTWSSLNANGLLGPGSRIKIDVLWYTIQRDPVNEGVIFTPDFVPNTNGNYRFRLILPPVVRPNQEPMLLPRGIVIDIARSQPRSFWKLGRLDVMFSPRGTVTGKLAAGGLIHFYLAETADVERLTAAITAGTFPNNTNYPNSESQYIPSENSVGSGPDAEPMRDRLIVTLFPQTGAISSHPVDLTDIDNNGVSDDPFRYAELGEIAGE